MGFRSILNWGPIGAQLGLNWVQLGSKEENNKEIVTVKTDISNMIADLKALQEKVKVLESNFETVTSRLDDSKSQIDEAKKEIKSHSKTLGKLDKKYLNDDEELRRCSLIIDGINERDNKRPKVVMEKLLRIDNCW